MIVPNRLFAIRKKTVLHESMIRKTAETSFSEADRAQTYSVQQQFGGWA